MRIVEINVTVVIAVVVVVEIGTRKPCMNDAYGAEMNAATGD